MTKTDAKTNPKEPGVYVVWLLGSRFPITLAWSGLERCWRRGSIKVQAQFWMGPLPK